MEIKKIFNLGILSLQTKKYKNAIEHFKKIVEMDGNNVSALNNIGIAFKELNDYQNAEDYFKKVIFINPNHIQAINNLGNVYLRMKNFDEAINIYKKAIKIKPDFIDANKNLGIAFKNIGDLDNSEKYYEIALNLDPSNPYINNGLSFVLLSKGKFDQGFKKYEYRKKINKQNQKLNSQEWIGESLEKKTILILTEQGIGDVIQFARYLFELKKIKAEKIILKTNKKLIHLFKNENFKVISEDEKIPFHDYYQYLLSLPGIFYKLNKKFSSEINFINYKEDLHLYWNKKIQNIKGFKVGISWQGSKNYNDDYLRSIPVKYFESLFNLDNISFINLQKGFGLEQLKNLKSKNLLYDFSSEVDNGQNAFEDTIAIIKNLDLVITSDTSLVHLSSTLKINTWLLLHYMPDWRWLLKKDNFSWYNSLRIYKQKKLDNWKNLFQDVKKDLLVYSKNI